MKRLVCKLRRKHVWSPWHPRHGRFRYRTRSCARCGLKQLHDINLSTITELPR